MSAAKPTSEVAGAARRMVRALGRRVGNGEVAELGYLTGLAAEVDAQLADAVAGLRLHGITDREIAAQLGVTRQAVSKRWPDHGRRRGAAGRYPSVPSC